VSVRRVVLASPRGFCAGVERAIGALGWMLRLFDPPVYCYHEIVHNRLVVEAFERAGVVFVDDVDDVPAGAPLMLSAHGTAPEVLARAKERCTVVLDAVCPLVTKVHHEIRTRAARGYHIVYVGHRGHEEAEGATAEAPDAITFVETELEASRVELGNEPIALLAQTTLAVPEWQRIAEIVQERARGEVWMPTRSDLCYATTNRQHAVTELAHRVDAMVIVGSANSSNTRALERVARRAGVHHVERVNHASELIGPFEGVVGLTAGASAAESVVQEVARALAPSEGIEELQVLEEDELFPLPPELRDLIGSVAMLVARATGTQAPSSFVDREPASEILAALASDTSRGS
jgi:4-hydroxy-3-methylbut-2-enyl diphosphate reductase